MTNTDQLEEVVLPDETSDITEVLPETTYAVLTVSSSNEEDSELMFKVEFTPEPQAGVKPPPSHRMMNVLMSGFLLPLLAQAEAAGAAEESEEE